MAARAISSGTIWFGLVSIPVRVHIATSAQTLRFNMLDAPHQPRDQYVAARPKGGGRARGKSGAK